MSKKSVLGMAICFVSLLGLGLGLGYQGLQVQNLNRKNDELGKKLNVLEESFNEKNKKTESQFGSLDEKISELDNTVNEHEKKTGIPTYDYNIPGQLEARIKYTYSIAVEYAYPELRIAGGGVIVNRGGKNYLITLEHILTGAERGENLYLITEYQNVRLTKEMEIARIKEEDFALYEIPKDIRVEAIPDELIGGVNELKVGEELYLISYQMFNINIRKGIISARDYKTMIMDYTNINPEGKTGVSNGLSAGDSGRPIWKLYPDGVLRFEALAEAGTPNNPAIGIGIDVKHLLELTDGAIAKNAHAQIAQPGSAPAPENITQ